MFFKDTRNPKGPRECDYVRFLYTALPKRSALLLVGEGCVGVAFFFFISRVGDFDEAGGEYLVRMFQKCHMDSAALVALVPFRVRVYRILREPLTLGLLGERSVFLM